MDIGKELASNPAEMHNPAYLKSLLQKRIRNLGENVMEM